MVRRNKILVFEDSPYGDETTQLIEDLGVALIKSDYQSVGILYETQKGYSPKIYNQVVDYLRNSYPSLYAYGFIQISVESV